MSGNNPYACGSLGCMYLLRSVPRGQGVGVCRCLRADSPEAGLRVRNAARWLVDRCDDPMPGTMRIQRLEQWASWLALFCREPFALSGPREHYAALYGLNARQWVDLQNEQDKGTVRADVAKLVRAWTRGHHDR